MLELFVKSEKQKLRNNYGYRKDQKKITTAVFGKNHRTVPDRTSLFLHEPHSSHAEAICSPIAR